MDRTGIETTKTGVTEQTPTTWATVFPKKAVGQLHVEVQLISLFAVHNCSLLSIVKQKQMWLLPAVPITYNTFFFDNLTAPGSSPVFTSNLTKQRGKYVARRRLVCVCLLWNSFAKESPRWPTFNKHAVTVSRREPTERRFSCLQLDPSFSHRDPSQFIVSWSGSRGAHHLERSLPIYLFEQHQMSAFVTTNLSPQTGKVMSSEPVEESRWRSPIWRVRFHKVCLSNCDLRQAQFLRGNTLAATSVMCFVCF